jgi:hypothetical protein
MHPGSKSALEYVACPTLCKFGEAPSLQASPVTKQPLHSRAQFARLSRMAPMDVQGAFAVVGMVLKFARRQHGGVPLNVPANGISYRDHASPQS